MDVRETTTVRYTTFRYTGWRRLLRRVTFRPVEGPTYEFEARVVPSRAFLPGLDSDDSDVTCFSTKLEPVGPIKKVSE